MPISAIWGSPEREAGGFLIGFLSEFPLNCGKVLVKQRLLV